MSLEGESKFIQYEQLPIPIICFSKYIKVNYLNSEAKDLLKKIKTFESRGDEKENKFYIPIWLNIKAQEFIKSDYEQRNFMKKIQVDEILYSVQLIFKKILDKDKNCMGIRVIINDVREYLESKYNMQKKVQDIKNSY